MKDNYKHYGGKGIKVCERWQKFENFYADMGERPEGATIERMENDKDYGPGNCRWATWREQANNRSSTVYLELNGERLPLTYWCDRLGIHRETVRARLRRGFSVKKALTMLVKRKVPASLQISVPLETNSSSNY